MGYVYRSLGDMERAQTSWQQAVDLDSESPRAWIGLGIVAQESGDLNAAIKNYSQGVEMQPSDVGYLLLAQALEKAGRASEAQKARQHASQLSKNLQGAKRVADGPVSSRQSSRVAAKVGDSDKAGTTGVAELRTTDHARG